MKQPYYLLIHTNADKFSSDSDKFIKLANGNHQACGLMTGEALMAPEANDHE